MRTFAEAWAEAWGMDPDDETRGLHGLLTGLMDVCDRSGEDFAALVENCIEERDDILGRFPEDAVARFG